MEHIRTRAQFVEEMREVTNLHLSELYRIWTEMGYETAELNQRMATAKTYIGEKYDEMIREENNHMEVVLKQIQKLEKERCCLKDELGRKTSQDDDKYLDSHIAYLQILKDITEEVEGYRNEKAERMVEVNMLHSEDEAASGEVGEETYKLRLGMIPTDKEMKELKEHIREMKSTKARRVVKFDSDKKKILELYNELECEPNNTFERNMICAEQREIKLSISNMNAIEKMLGSLQAELDANRTTMEKMIQRTEVLCARLDIDKNKHLSSDMVGYSRRQLKEVGARLEELEVMKMAHLSKFVEKSRQELRGLWDQCYFGQEQRNAFRPICSTDYNEEMLDEHENEVERLKGFLKENSEIFEKVNIWQSWWDRKKALQDRAKDPNRLFARRGNTLLKEQQEEKEVKRNLPKVERELRGMVQEYENRQDSKFTLMGMPFDQYIEETRTEGEVDAKFEQMERKEQKRKLLEHETMYGVGGKPLTPISNLTRTPNKSRRVDNKSRLQTPNSISRKLAAVDKLGGSTSYKRPGAQLDSNSKRMRMNENSIISGNLMNAHQSVDSTASYKDRDVISSTFCKESNLYQPGSATRKTPLRTTQMKSSTPVRSNIRTPGISDTTFKTPSSRARLVASTNKDEIRNRTLRSSARKVPFKF